MRGTPWIRFCLMAIALALAGIPIVLLTGADEPPVPPTPSVQPQAAERELTLTIETAPAAQAIGASYLGRQLIPLTHKGGSFSGTIHLPTGSAADLVLKAEWTSAEKAALRASASDENGLLVEASFWGAARIEDVLTIP